VDPHCVETVRANNDPLRNVWQVDIRAVDPKAAGKTLGIAPGELGILHGGPPCQPFSQIGKQLGVHDHRGLLAFEMLRFAKALRPAVVLMEQVAGFAKALSEEGTLLVDVFREEFASLGYTMAARVLNAADYGVPQNRKRLFLVAVRQDLKKFSPEFAYPAPTLSQRCARQVLADLPRPVLKGQRALFPNHIDGTPERDRERIAPVMEGGCLAKSDATAELKQRLTAKDTTKFRRLAWDEPALTLRCGEIFYHPVENRYLTPREYMRLHTYPDDYVLHGPIRGRTGQVKTLDQHRQVANSVPPMLARQMAEGALSVVCL
jgi:DNA (cytosine-5)-methyltransferase 1